MSAETPRAYTRDELLALKPSRYLAQGYLDDKGAPRAELQGSFATAAATQLFEGELSPQELTFAYEALRHTLPQHTGPLPKRLASALDEALEVVRGLIRQPNNPSLTPWMRECVAHVKSAADLEAFFGHLLAVLRMYTVIAAARSR